MHMQNFIKINLPILSQDIARKQFSDVTQAVNFAEQWRKVLNNNSNLELVSINVYLPFKCQAKFVEDDIQNFSFIFQRK